MGPRDDTALRLPPTPLHPQALHVVGRASEPLGVRLAGGGGSELLTIAACQVSLVRRSWELQAAASLSCCIGNSPPARLHAACLHAEPPLSYLLCGLLAPQCVVCSACTAGTPCPAGARQQASVRYTALLTDHSKRARLVLWIK